MSQTATPSRPMQVDPVSAVAERNVKELRHFWGSYAWPEAGDEWSAALGGTASLWYNIILPRISPFIPTGHLLEIAPGHGRCTQFLRHLCEHLTIVDLVPACIEACRRRFNNDPRITFAVNDGTTLPMVTDASIDFAFSWDSLVHVEHGVMRSYVAELARTLKPGAAAFIHHSNLGRYEGQTDKYQYGKDLHGRGRTMTAEKFRRDCREVGLRCVTQEIIPWGSTGLFIDAFSLCVRDPENAHLEPTVEEHPEWRAECTRSNRLARLYKRQ